MKKLFEIFLCLSATFSLCTFSSAQEISSVNDVFDYCQMKRTVANEIIGRVPAASVNEINYAINMQKDLLIYLDKPEIRALAEISQNIKSQRADVRFDLAKALLTANRQPEALKILSELADETSVGVYANQMKKAPFTSLESEPEYQSILRRLNVINNFWESDVVKTPYQPNLGEDEKILGLSTFWSNAKFSFVYFDQLPDLNWDKVYLEYLSKIRQTKSTYEYYRVLQEMCALLKDGHTNVFLPQNLYEEMEVRPPMRAMLVEDKVLVWRVSSETLKSQGIETGVEILKIDGIPVKEYAEKFVKPYQSSSTAQDLIVRMYTYALFAGDKNKPIELELKNAKGVIFKRSVARTGYTDAAAPLSPLEFKVLSENVGYLALNTFGSEKVSQGFVENFDEIAKTDSLIIDLRNNGGGDSYFGYSILASLTDKPFQLSRWSAREHRAIRRANRLNVEWFGENAGTISPNKQRFYGKPVVVLTSPRTFSAAEDFLVAFDFMKRGLIIGEPTGGSTGQPMSFSLPGGGSARICSKRDTYADGKKFVGIGIQPNISVSPKVSDFVENKDSVMETALQELKKRK